MRGFTTRSPEAIVNATNRKPTLEFRRRTESARLADLHLQLHPGTNVALLNGMGRMMLMQGLLDTTFIQARTQGFDDWRQAIEPFTLEVTKRITGVRRPSLAKPLAATPRAVPPIAHPRSKA